LRQTVTGRFAVVASDCHWTWHTVL